jgi:predicted GIY-YIG superfamily endonuclease
MPFCVYILRCRDASYYVGHTDDIEARMNAHTQGLIECYTKTRLPVRLMFCQEFESRDEAFAKERQLKGWSRAKKEALIKGNSQRLAVLSRNHTDVLSGRLRQAQSYGFAGPSTSSG